MAQLNIVDIGLAFQDRRSKHQEAGRAIAALQGMIFVKRLLQRIECVSFGKALNRA